MTQPHPFTWDVEVFTEYYNAIRYQNQLPMDLERCIGHDLRTLLNVPAKNEKSRASLVEGENGKPVKFHNGMEFELNKPFIADTSAFSTELSLDELCAAELLQSASNSSSNGSDLTDAARLAYFQRTDYVLNIVGYLVAEKKLLLLYRNEDPAKALLAAILASFKKIYEHIRIQNDLIDKQKVTSDINDLHFVSRLKYMKNQLFDTHRLLSQVLYTLMDTYIDDLGTWDTYTVINSHIKECITDDSDVLLMHYLPTLMRVVTRPNEISESEVMKFHLNFVKALSSDYSKVCGTSDVIDLSQSSIRIYSLVVKLIFFIAFVPWCKQLESRTRKFDFEKDILKYVEWLISYGTLEQILSFTAESARPEARVLLEQTNLYNFRPLLQKTFPELKPVKFVYPGNEELLQLVKQKPEMTNVATLCDYESFKLSTEYCDSFLAPYFHTFITNFISHAAVVLTLLRDSEEDFLMSSATRKQIESESTSVARHGSVSGGDFDHFVHSSKRLNEVMRINDTGSQQGLNLDEIATRAELEKFYMSCVYTYTDRQNLCEQFWSADDSNVIGFISWGISNNTSPLITATFCLLLGSLTFGGETASAKVWDILVNSQSGTIKRNDYSKISIDSIINSLTYYIDALTENLEADLGEYMKKEQKKQEFLFSSSSLAKQDTSSKSLSIQLSEDSIVFISGFLLLVSSIVKNACGQSPVAKNLRLIAFSRFQPVITSFLKFDNLMISAKSLRNDNKVAPVIFNDENRTIIINLIINLLSTFACDHESLDIRNKVWIMVDRWLCYNINETDSSSNAPSENSRYTAVSLSSNPVNSVKSELTKLKLLHRGISLKQSFDITLTNLSEVINFVRLMKRLLAPSSNDENTKSFSLPYPANLGLGYRHKNQIGVWPYIEYLLIEVLGKTASLKDNTSKRLLQVMLLEIIDSSLCEIDWPFINDIAPNILVNLSKENGMFAASKLVSGDDALLSYQNFLKLHHSLAVMNYLFDDRANNVLFDIINIGSEALENNALLNQLVQLSLKTFNKVLEQQDVFIAKILPLLKNSDSLPGGDNGVPMGYGTTMSLVVATPKSAWDNIYYPGSLGTKGVSDFYEVLLFHIPSIVHFALYVGNPDASIADDAIKILDKISQSQMFSRRSSGAGNHLLERNRLLSIFESIDESLRIQFGFVQQMQMPTASSLLQTKYSILKYLIANLPTAPEVSVAHFLLGYAVRADRLVIDDSEDNVVLLRALIEILISTLDLISEVDYSKGYKHQIGIGPAKLTALIMEIIVRLCRNLLTSRITLKFLRESDLFSKLLTSLAKIDDMTIWQNHQFEGDLLNGVTNNFIQDDDSCQTFFSFITYRNCVLQYLSLELHDIRSISRKEYYVNLLLESTEFLNGTPKVLNFLDVLNYQFYNVDEHRFDKFEKKYNLNSLLIEFKNEKEIEGDKVPTLNKVLQLSTRLTQINVTSEMNKTIANKESTEEVQKLEVLLNKFIVARELQALHLKSLHSWVQIIQVLTSDVVNNKSDFILKVLQMVLPKINNEYYERDIQFAEELMSLCVLLFDLYEAENSETQESTEHKLQRLLPLFKTCVNGVLSPNSTASLRSDLYLLLNKFLQRSIKAETILHHVLSILRSIDKRFIDIVCKDSIYSEGVPRITSIIFMESLIHLSTIENSSSILDVLVRNNSLSLLVRSLKRTDEIIFACGEKKSGISVETLVYELTALKLTLYVLIRIAQNKQGASQLVQNEIFPVIRQLKILSIDADLGLDLNIEVAGNALNSTKEAYFHLSLDVREKEASSAAHRVSFYEYLVPAFQLVATVLLSMGPSYTPGILQAQELMEHHRLLVAAIVKKDALIENDTSSRAYEEQAFVGLGQLVRLFTLIDSLMHSSSDDHT